MTVYSTLFARQTITSTGVTVLYTVPSGYVAVVRCVTLNGYSATPGSCQILGAGIPLAGSPSGIASDFPYTENLRHVLNAGDAIEAYILSGDWQVYVSGYLLSLP